MDISVYFSRLFRTVGFVVSLVNEYSFQSSKRSCLWLVIGRVTVYCKITTRRPSQQRQLFTVTNEVLLVCFQTFKVNKLILGLRLTRNTKNVKKKLKTNYSKIFTGTHLTTDVIIMPDAIRYSADRGKYFAYVVIILAPT